MQDLVNHEFSRVQGKMKRMSSASCINHIMYFIHLHALTFVVWSLRPCAKGEGNEFCSLFLLHAYIPLEGRVVIHYLDCFFSFLVHLHRNLK